MIYKRKYLYHRIVKAKIFIDDNYTKKINLDHITNESWFSKYHFIRLFKKAYGLTPNQYLIKKRIEKAKVELETTNKTVKEICHSLNFESPSSFTHLFKRITAQTPSQFRTVFKIKEHKRQHNPLSQIPGCFTLAHKIKE